MLAVWQKQKQLSGGCRYDMQHVSLVASKATSPGAGEYYTHLVALFPFVVMLGSWVHKYVCLPLTLQVQLVSLAHAISHSGLQKHDSSYIHSLTYVCRSSANINYPLSVTAMLKPHARKQQLRSGSWRRNHVPLPLKHSLHNTGSSSEPLQKLICKGCCWLHSKTPRGQKKGQPER